MYQVPDPALFEIGPATICDRATAELAIRNVRHGKNERNECSSRIVLSARDRPRAAIGLACFEFPRHKCGPPCAQPRRRRHA